MAAYNAMWLPGTDHAGIATQMVVERELRATEKKSRHDLGREEFVKRIWQWRERYGSRILEQLKVMGCSLDWERLKFTMEPEYSRAVIEAFVQLHEEGLIYRDRRLINWCVSCRTALSDLEVEHDAGAQGELYEFAYQLADGSGEVVVATTRPETMLGDTAVAVHPDDPRHQAKIGKLIKHPFTGREFPVIADPVLVDPKFGTGAVKVTPPTTSIAASATTCRSFPSSTRRGWSRPRAARSLVSTASRRASRSRPSWQSRALSAAARSTCTPSATASAATPSSSP
jgi:valyl-tRNA synthetase